MLLAVSSHLNLFLRIVISSESEKSFSFAVKKGCGGAGSGKHRTPGKSGPRCFMQTDSHRKQIMASAKDPSATLGMTIRGNAPPTRPPPLCKSQPPPLRGTSFQRKEVDCHFPCRRRSIREYRLPYFDFERGTIKPPHRIAPSPVSSFRAKKNTAKFP